MELKLGSNIQEELKNGRDNKQTILMVENIEKLKLKEFSLADTDNGRVSTKHDLRVEFNLTIKISVFPNSNNF